MWSPRHPLTKACTYKTAGGAAQGWAPSGVWCAPRDRGRERSSSWQKNPPRHAAVGDDNEISTGTSIAGITPPALRRAVRCQLGSLRTCPGPRVETLGHTRKCDGFSKRKKRCYPHAPAFAHTLRRYTVRTHGVDQPQKNTKTTIENIGHGSPGCQT